MPEKESNNMSIDKAIKLLKGQTPGMRIKRRKLWQQLLRFAIQVAFFLLLPALFSTGFAGVRSVATQIAARELITVNSFVLTALIIVASVFVFGRFFCGYACAFGAMGDWLHAVSAFVFRRFGRTIPRLPVRLVHLLQLLKYLILLAILAACLTGNYRAISGYDPWSIFAALISGNPESVYLFDGWQIATLAFAAIVLGMLFVERFFCQFLCPFGALMALVPALPLLVPGRNQAKCLSGCSACSRSCPASLSLGENHATAGECFQCGRCKTVCPKDNINSLLNKLNSSETAACIVQAAVFAAVIVGYQLG